MKIYHPATILAALFIGILHISSVTAKEESRSVSASVSGGGRGVGIRAERVPGRFTVPEGHIATGFKYHFTDPSINYTSTRLSGSNIYSETRGREMSEVEGNPNAQLPPGKYKFVVGGRPGSYGTLNFKIVSTTVDPPEDRPPADNRRLPVNFDVIYSVRTDVYYTQEETKKRVIDWGDGGWDFPEEVTVRFRNGKADSEYTLHYPTVPGLKGTDTHTLVGTLADGRFSGTKTIDRHYEVTLRTGQVLHRDTGIVYALTGQVASDGLLVLHGRWQSDYGQEEEMQLDGRGATIPIGNGKVKITTKKYESHPSVRSGTWELHLRLPVDRNPSPPKTTRTQPPVTQPTATPPQTPNPGTDIATTPTNTDWDIPSNDPPWEQPSKPPVTQTERPEPKNIWNAGDDRPEVDDLVTDDDDEDGPKVGDRLPDGKILFKPPWDIGDPYPMNAEEVAGIKKRQADGYRWTADGWVNDEDQKHLDSIAETERINDEKVKKGSEDRARTLKESEDRAREHDKRAKRAGDLALMQKAKALGWGSLSSDERKQLSQADEDIRDYLRGKPKEMRGYKRGIVDKTLPQGVIDTTHTALKGVKWATDETVDFIGSKTGPAGKAIGTAYTMGTNIAGKLSEENANYNSGMSDKADYTKAAKEGAKDGLTDVIVNELSGKVSDKATDALLESRAGKKVADYVEGQADRAKKQYTRDALSGKVDDLNPHILDNVGDAAAEGARQNVNYGVNRAGKPGYDATMKQPVSDAVNKAAGTEKPKKEPEAAEPGDEPVQLDEIVERLEEQ